jgi:hypothetical protein
MQGRRRQPPRECTPADGPSFDYFVGERHQIRLQLNAGGLGGLQIDHERIVRRLLERQITRLRAPANAADVSLNTVFIELPDGHGRSFSGNYLSSVNPTRKVTW